MSIKLGNDYLVWIKQLPGGTFALIKGQQSGNLKISAGTFDASSKDSGGYTLKGTGLVDIELDFTLVANQLPDTAGFGVLQTAATAVPRTTVELQIRKGGTAGVDPGDVIFDAPFYVSDFSPSFGQNNVVSFSPKFVLAGVPVTPFTMA